MLFICIFSDLLVAPGTVTKAIPKSTSDWLVKRIQNTEQNFIIWNSYIHICITSPHSCHPHLGTCRTMALAFAVFRQRTAHRQVMQPGIDDIHELFVGVETLGSQPDLHLGEELVIAWHQVRTVRRVVKNLPVEELD